MRSPGCSSTPTPTRSACPTRGSRSSTRSSTNGATPSPSAPTRPGSTSRPRCARPGSRSSRVDTHRPAGDFDVVAFNLSAELVYTNLLNCLDLGGIPVRAEARSDEDPLVLAGGHCTFNPEPLADFVDAFVIGDGEEPVGEITEVVGAWKRGGRVGGREAVLHDLATIPGVYVPSMYDVEYDGQWIRAVTPRYPDVPARRRQAHGRRPRGLAVPEAAARAAHRGGARPAERRDLPRLHARLPLLPGRDDHPARARAPGRPGAHDGRGRAAPHRLRRGRAHVAVERRLLRHRRRSSATSSTSRRAAATSGSRSRRCGSTRSPSAWRARSRRCAAPG